MKVMSRILMTVWLVGRGTAVSGAVPAIESITPGAVRPGVVTEVIVRGSGLKNVSEVWKSFTAEALVLPDKSSEDGKSATLRITTPAETQVGVVTLRVMGKNGVSNPFLMMIDDLPSVAPPNGIASIEKAVKLDWPVAVDGVCDDSYSDFYRVKLRRGRRVAIECVAQRIGSQLDPLLRLYDVDGRQVAGNDDGAGIGADARLSFIPRATGEYTVEVRDSIHEKGKAHRYRLRVGAFPFATLAFPLGGEPEAGIEPVFLGTELEDAGSVKLTMRSDASRQRIGVPGKKGGGSGFVSMVADALPDVVEIEPNNLPEQTTRVSPPVAINGRFETRRDRDCYEFKAGKGDALAFVGQTRSLGSPSALHVRLFDSKGKLLKQADVTGANEAGLTNRFAADGIYRLQLEELTHAGGPSHGYRMEVRPWTPGFRLSVTSDTTNAKAGASFDIKVDALRDKGFAEPITLSVEGLWEDATLEGEVIAKDKKDTKIKITLPKEVEVGGWRQIKIVGRAKSGDEELRAVASTMPALRKRFPEMPFPPVDLDGKVTVGVRGD